MLAGLVVVAAADDVAVEHLAVAFGTFEFVVENQLEAIVVVADAAVAVEAIVVS